ncbi:GyrI-like domain-containing protein [Paenibacillus sp. YIM B09110]|uniref:GyrI-like domain-containing protein n=1 Tax=Paenibacillus sp. YIM B09110 TaxID=3126102 RepID=UPI00301B9222
MSKKIDYKKDYKNIYLPPVEPVIIDVDTMPYMMISGEGNPNGEEYVKKVEALYRLSYAVKMSYKSDVVPSGYYEYTVFPLEGIWDLIDTSKPATDLDNLKYTIMIRQPDFLTEELFNKLVDQTNKKKPMPLLNDVVYGEMTDSLSCQMMHIGRYADEPASFAKMEAYCNEHGYERSALIHREIYISDPRKTDAAKLKTVLRFNVNKRN